MKKLKLTFLLLLAMSLSAAGQNSLLYKIQKKGQPDSYLFGTFHIFPQNQFEISEAVRQSLQASDQLVMELAMEDGFQMKMMQYVGMKDGKTLEDFLSSPELKLLDSALKENGLSRSFFNTWRPSFLASLFYPSYMPGGVASFEFSLKELAEKWYKPILGLETIERQVEVFDKIPYEDQARDLVEILSDYDKNKELFDQMVEVYLSGDVETIVELTYKELNNQKEVEALLNERNQEWIPRMEELMAAQACFFAVGAGHLGGNEGVISLLRKKGYKLTPVTN